MEILCMDNPILTIVTLHWVTPKREETFKRCVESIQHLIDSGDVQHLVTYDEIGRGYQGSCQLMVEHKDEAIGHFVWTLDDDDTLALPTICEHLKRIKTESDPDLIMVRGTLHKMLLPRQNLWDAKDIMVYKINTTGLPLFIMKNWVFREYIHNVALRNDHNHDFDIMAAWQRDMPIRKFRIAWLDEIMVRQRENETLQERQQRILQQSKYGKHLR